MTKAGIYIHIPFCKSKCIYCDFYSMEKREKDIPRFVDMLIREIELTALNYNEDWIFDTIFFGGGTPSLMEPWELEKILHILDRSFDISKVTEITLEANPGEASLQKLSKFYKLGINRLSIGFQSLQQKLLTSLSRIHSTKDCISTYRNAQEAGFKNINIDMIFNIPGQSLEVYRDDLEQVVELEPNHISAYSLTVEKNTPFYKKIQDGEITMPSDEVDLDMFEFSQKYLGSHNYCQYEISNYARDGMECRHNFHYWNLDPYLGFGPAAHGYDGHIRWWNTSSLDAYMQMLKHNEIPLSGTEILSRTDHYNEVVINGLRSKEGIQIRKINLHKIDPEKMHSTIIKWKEQLNITEEAISLKSEAYKFADEIASDMMQT